MIERTDTWALMRAGKVTGSQFSTVMTKARKKGDLSKGAETYLFELMGEHRRMMPKKEAFAPALNWGHQHEEKANDVYNAVMALGGDSEFSEALLTEFVLHPNEELIGCSPDGFVGKDGIVEIKCPWTPTEFERVAWHRTVPSQYKAQVQGNLWVCCKEWCDFVVYDPRIPTRRDRIVIVRVERDEKYIDELRDAVIDFRDELQHRLKERGIAEFAYERTEEYAEEKKREEEDARLDVAARFARDEGVPPPAA